MNGKNFAFSFQIGAAFAGNKAFTSAIAKTQELASSTREFANQMKAIDKAYNNKVINLASRLNAQQVIGAQYSPVVQQYKAQKSLAAAQGKLEQSTGNMAKYAANTQQFASIGKAFMSISDVAVSFEAGMSKVQALTGAEDKDLQRLKNTALELGKKTQYSATQAADAMSYLGMAGWKTEQIISAMPGLLDLAAASGEDLALVADIVSDDLTAFGMKADQAGRMADVFAAISSNANTNVAMMGQTFKYAGAVAGSLGFSLEDVAKATGLMANAGIKADQAGTSLRSIMTRLVKPPKEAREALEQLNISATDASGKMKPLGVILGEMREKFSKLSAAEKGQMGAAIAGQEAMSGFLSLMNAAPDDVAKLDSAIAGCNGAAKRMADTMQNNAKGKMIAFQSAVESLQITMGNALLPAMTQGTIAATGLAQALGDYANENPNVVTGVTAATGAVIAFGAAG